MAENLKVTHYNNGDEIPNGVEVDEDISDGLTWLADQLGVYFEHDIENYGRLYNQFVVYDEREVCPLGWHVPNHGEWAELEIFLGMSQEQAMQTGGGWRGTDEGGKLKTIGTIEIGDGLWNSPNTGASNLVGFSANPAGNIEFIDYTMEGYVNYINIGQIAIYWTSTYDILRGLHAYYSAIEVHGMWNDWDAFAVRCLQDEITTGCTDPYSSNYDETANVDDGSCTYPETSDYSLEFDGVDDYVELSPIDLSCCNSLTFSLDVWVDEFTPYIVLLRQDGAQFDWLLQINLNGSYIESQVITNTHNHAGIYHYIDADNFLNNWNNISTTYDGEYINIYINGELVQSGAWDGIINHDDDNTLYFGGLPLLDGHYLNGKLDNIGIWDVALTESQIQTYMTTPPTGNETGLAGFWKFNAGDGTTLYDHSGNQNHGMIHGTTWVLHDMAGCTDASACNYNSQATVDDGSCAYEFDCAGECGGDLELDCGGVCGGDNSTALSCCGLPFYEDCTTDCYEDSMGVCCIDEDADYCGMCFGGNSSCMGDVNIDGALNVLDILILVNLIIYPDTPPTDTELALLDLLSDEILNVSDVIILVNMVLNEAPADSDGDGVIDEDDSDPNNPYQCSDLDGDTCDDCSTGTFNPTDDGYDYDGDGQCDDGDCDDDNDGCQECWDYCP